MIYPQLRCVDCDEEINPADPSILFQVTGWERLREQGGQNHVRFKVRTGKVMCNKCATVRKYAKTPQQATLL